MCEGLSRGVWARRRRPTAYMESSQWMWAAPLHRWGFRAHRTKQDSLTAVLSASPLQMNCNSAAKACSILDSILSHPKTPFHKPFCCSNGESSWDNALEFCVLAANITGICKSKERREIVTQAHIALSVLKNYTICWKSANRFSEYSKTRGCNPLY